MEQLDLSGIDTLDCTMIGSAVEEFGVSAVFFDQDCPLPTSGQVPTTNNN
jgi:hypothetical protein